ncbi:MAG TPA: GGDEF domain-containing protein, partial [Rhodocyclaceae bacterium]|nr:GGDEF domain-containing protein [Rhodocyclaceae bacterium]
ITVDVDHFKRINDTHGHEAGDRLLQAVAARFRSILRETDTLARLGGDEFVLVVPELDYDGYAEVVAEKCRSVFDSPFVIGGCELRAAASIGIALYPLDGEDARSLLAAADRAMYAAKEAERGATRALTGG